MKIEEIENLKISHMGTFKTSYASPQGFLGYGLEELSPPYFTERMRGKELLSLSSYFKKFL